MIIFVSRKQPLGTAGRARQSVSQFARRLFTGDGAASGGAAAAAAAAAQREKDSWAPRVEPLSEVDQQLGVEWAALDASLRYDVTVLQKKIESSSTKAEEFSIALYEQLTLVASLRERAEQSEIDKRELAEVLQMLTSAAPAAAPGRRSSLSTQGHLAKQIAQIEAKLAAAEQQWAALRLEFGAQLQHSEVRCVCVLFRCLLLSFPMCGCQCFWFSCRSPPSPVPSFLPAHSLTLPHTHTHAHPPFHSPLSSLSRLFSTTTSLLHRATCVHTTYLLGVAN